MVHLWLMKMILPEIHFRIWTSFASVVAEDLTGYCLEGQPHTKGPDLTLHKWLYVLQDTYPCSTRLHTKRFHPGLRADGAAPTCILRVYALLWFHGFPLKHPTLQGFLGLLKQTSKRNRLLTSNMEKQPQKPQVLSFILFSRCLERSGKSCVTQGKGSNSQESLLHLMENSAAACPSQFPSDPMSHSKQSWAILLTDAWGLEM